jgi:hypothetical protein
MSRAEWAVSLLWGSLSPREDHLLCREVWAGGVSGVQPDCLRVLRVAAPPGRVLVCAGWQSFSDDLGHLGEGHLDPQAADCLQVPFQALVLLPSDHDDIMAGWCR